MHRQQLSLRIAIAITVLSLWSTPALHTQSLPDIDIDPDWWLMKVITETTHDSNTIFVSQMISDDCPFDATEAESLINGVLIRSRILPLDFQFQEYLEHVKEGLLHLKITVQCLRRDPDNPIFVIDAYFAIVFAFTPGDIRFAKLLLDRNFGTFGLGGSDYILSTIEDAVERAATVYIKAHMERQMPSQG